MHPWQALHQDVSSDAHAHSGSAHEVVPHMEQQCLTCQAVLSLTDLIGLASWQALQGHHNPRKTAQER